MKKRRPLPIPVNVTVTISDGLPKCPLCHQTYDFSMPLLGFNGVGTAYCHETDDMMVWHHAMGVLKYDDNDIDSDGTCVYEVEPAIEV